MEKANNFQRVKIAVSSVNIIPSSDNINIFLQIFSAIDFRNLEMLFGELVITSVFEEDPLCQM